MVNGMWALGPWHIFSIDRRAPHSAQTWIAAPSAFRISPFQSSNTSASDAQKTRGRSYGSTESNSLLAELIANSHDF